MENFLEDIGQLNSKNLIIYGAGGLGVDLLNKLDRDYFNITLVDDFLHGKRVMGYNVKKFEDLEIKNNEQIIICSRFINQFKNKIKQNYLIYYDDIDNTSSINFDVCSNSNQYKEVRQMLKGESLDLFDALIQFRNLSNPNRKHDFHSMMSRKGIGNQYLTFAPAPRSDLQIIVDCGVFDGQTSYLFSNYFYHFKRIDGFDPLIKKTLKNSYYFNELAEKEFNLIEYGLFNTKGEHEFFINYSNLSGSSLFGKDESETIVVSVTTIDDYYLDQNLKISFLKMDIEGAELEAISGGIETIKRDRPYLAISIYHTPEQMYEIPFFLMNNLENYQWEIGHYSYGFNETVLYGIPK